MSEHEKPKTTVSIEVLVCIVALAVAATGGVVTVAWQKNVVAHGCAYYDENGKFEWFDGAR